jgi:hypothetical protein
MREDNLDYSRRRAKQEAMLALSQNDPAIAEIHRQMANAYRQRVAELANNFPRSISA